MRRRITMTISCLAVIVMMAATPWGFYGHRLINRVAVFTMPDPLFSFYKKHIKYIQELATAPDKRRNSSPVEAVRHYIDLDHWYDYDRSLLRQPYVDVILTFAQIDVVDGDQMYSYDGLSQTGDHLDWVVDHYVPLSDSLFWRTNDLIVDGSVQLTIDGAEITVTDQFSEHGIVPYHLRAYYQRLVGAMERQEVWDVIRLSAELGHYVSDAHVPLHTTKNYNGQLTGQDGIHAFWETRIPELFAEAEYDFFVDRAQYIEDIDSFFWKITLSSHELVDDVLGIEMQLREEFPRDQQYCYERRGNVRVRVPCAIYSAEYQNRMQDMVERRMTESITAVGSLWYSAWIDAGRPALDRDMAAEIASMPIDTTESYENEMRPNIKNQRRQ